MRNTINNFATASNKFVNASCNMLSLGMQAGLEFTKEHPKLVFGFALAACMTVVAATSENFLYLNPDGEDTTLICLGLETLGKKVAYRFYDLSGTDNFYANMGEYNGLFSCGLGKSANYPQIAACLQRGVGLFGRLNDGAEVLLVEALDFAKTCGAEVARMMR